MRKNEIKEICNSNSRLPIGIRIDKAEAVKFLKIIKNNNFIIKNEYILPLADWCDFDINEYKHDEQYSRVLNIEYAGNEQTYDLEVNNGHSYTANGIIAHNTINLPKDVSVEKVSEIYLEAWKKGLKGVTVYREGSRDGILLSNSGTSSEKHANKRPKRLKAEIHRFQNNLEKWIAVVGLKDGKIYEIFTGLHQNGLSELPSNLKDCEVVKNIIETEKPDENGQLVKIRTKRYDIEYTDSNGVKQVHMGLNYAFNPEFWNYAKLISGLFREGMETIYVYNLVESLNFKEDHINTWKNGVARVIKKFIKDGEKAKGKCSECGSENLVFNEGCLICQNCGAGKCQ